MKSTAVNWCILNMEDTLLTPEMGVDWVVLYLHVKQRIHLQMRDWTETAMECNILKRGRNNELKLGESIKSNFMIRFLRFRITLALQTQD